MQRPEWVIGRIRGHVGVVAIVLLLGVFLSGCGGGGEETPSADSEATQAPEPEPEETTEEEKLSACLTTKKGPVVKIAAGGSQKASDQFADVQFYPSKLKLPAGKFVTIKVISKSSRSHTFTIDPVDCDTGSITAGQTATVSFKVPMGTTPFYCTPHEAFMTGEIIGVAK